MEEKSLLKQDFEAELLKAQMEIREQTLEKVGADLHDSIGQLLSLTNLTLKSIEVEDPIKTKQKTERAIDLTSRSIQELRLLGKLLQGEQLISQGLSYAIKHELEWLNKLDHYQIDCRDETLDTRKLNMDKELILFRLFQEIINNILKHAAASRIMVLLSNSDDDLILKVADNGKGFNTENLLHQSTGMGLNNIHKRANIIGGKINISSQPGQGTEINISVPY